MNKFIKSINLFKQVTLAGFSLAGAKAINTHDGYCWHATLCAGKTKIVTVSNGGFGGPDEFDFLGSSWGSASKKLLQPLFALALVKEYFQDHFIQMEEWSLEAKKCTPEEFALKKASILAGEYQIDCEMLGYLVDEIRSAKAEIASLKRKLKGKIGWRVKGKEDEDNYFQIALEDSPENRKKLLEKYPDISIFVNDLVKDI